MNPSEEWAYDPSLVFYLPLYKLDGGTFASKDAYGHLGTNSGSIWILQGRKFDGIDDEVSVPNATALNPTEVISAEIWIRLPAYPTDWAYPLNKGSNAQYYFRIGTNGIFGWILSYNSFAKIPVTPSPLPLNTWQHMVGTYDGANIRIFQNGVQVTIVAQTGSLLTSTNVLYLGSAGGYSFTNCLIGEARIYNRALTPQEIQSLYLATKARFR